MQEAVNASPIANLHQPPCFLDPESFATRLRDNSSVQSNSGSANTFASLPQVNWARCRRVFSARSQMLAVKPFACLNLGPRIVVSWNLPPGDSEIPGVLMPAVLYAPSRPIPRSTRLCSQLAASKTRHDHARFSVLRCLLTVSAHVGSFLLGTNKKLCTEESLVLTEVSVIRLQCYDQEHKTGGKMHIRPTKM